jgi:hypothetical protein
MSGANINDKQVSFKQIYMPRDKNSRRDYEKIL